MPLSVDDGARLLALEAELRRRGGGGDAASPPTASWQEEARAPGWTFQQIDDRIAEEERKYPNIPRGLAKAVAYHESRYELDASGDGGEARSLFQLHPGAAKDVGIDPNRRHLPELSVQGGVKYLSQKIAQAGGNIDQALSLYNRGTPEYQGVGDPNYLRNVYQYWKERPGSAQTRAEASTPQTAPHSRLEELEAELARREGQATPQPPTATSTPAQDAAFRASRGQQASAPVSQPSATTPTPPQPQEAPGTPDTTWTPGMRFQALPSITQLAPADRMQKTQLFESLSPALQEEFLRSEEPAGQRSPALPAPPGLPGAQMEGNLLSDRSQIAEGGPQVPLPTAFKEAGKETAATGIDILFTAGGAALGGLTSPVTGLGGPIVGGAAGGIGATRANVALGLRPQEAPLVETPYVNVYPSDVLGVGTSLLVGLPAMTRSVLARSRAGRAIVAADEATAAARVKWQADTQAAEQAAVAQQKELYDTAVIRAKASQRDYEMAARARQEKIAASRAEYDEAVRVGQADTLAKEQARQQTIAQRSQEYQDAVRAQQADTLAKEQARQQTIAGRSQEYQQAVTGQQQAITQAKAVPGRYTPETPSWVLYEKFGDAAKDAVVDLTPAKAELAQVRASRGMLPDGTARPLPSQVESIAANLEHATGETSIKTIREELRRLGPLTRSVDGNVRGAAKQLYGIYADVLEASPVANDLLRNANATFRKEMALQDLQEWLRPGHGVVRIDQQGRQTINVGTLLTRLEKEIGDNSLFRGAFAPDELQALRQDFGQLAGTPAMPRQAPREPAPVVPGALPAPPREPPPVVPGRPPTSPREPAPVALPGDVRVPQVPVLVATAAPSPVTPRQQLGARPKVLGARAGEWGAVMATLQALGVPTTALAAAAALRVGQRQASWLLANAMVSEKGQQVLRAAIDARGTLNPRVYVALLATMTAAEKKAYERETQGQGR